MDVNCSVVQFPDGDAHQLAQTRDDAFAEYVLPHMAELRRVAVAITTQHADAEDLLQDTLLSAYRAIDRFDGRYPRAWLLTILRRHAINRHRGPRPQFLGERAEDLPRPEPAGVESPEEFVLAESLGRIIAGLLANLPESHQSVVRLVVMGGLSYAEAAQRLEVPEGTVMSRLHRARRRIRNQLASAGIVSGR